MFGYTSLWVNYSSALFPSFLVIFKLSKGLLILPIFIFLVLTCVYISVVFELLCPSSSWIYLRSIPLSSRWVANECLKLWTLSVFLGPEFFQAFSKIRWTVMIVICFSWLGHWNSHMEGLCSFQCFLNISKATSESSVYLSFLPFAPFMKISLLLTSISSALIRYLSWTLYVR